MRAALLPLALIAQPANAQSLPDVDSRLREIVGLLNGTGDYDATFGPRFRAEVPRERFDAIATQLRVQQGRATAVAQVERQNALEASATLSYERGNVRVRISLEPGGTRRVAGFIISGSAPAQDSLAAIMRDAATLPGNVAIGVYALEEPAPRALAELHGDRAMPLGSAFKLWVLAELAAQVESGQRRWNDVMPLGRPSLPSGMTQDWPAGTPMTLQSLATLMISISDNTATDTLITLLGRDRIDARAVSLGADPASLPVLTTAELFRLKHPQASGIAGDWATLSPAQRRARLDDPKFATIPLNPAIFGDTAIQPQVEWFATPRVMARTLDWLSRKGGKVPLAILATTRQDRQGFAYKGFKGGSEPGVLSLNHLARDTQGRWFAVCATQMKADGPIDPSVLSNLILRAFDAVRAAR